MNNFLKQAMAIRKNANVVFVAAVDEDGYPAIKAMNMFEHKSLKYHYFSTNASSKRVALFRNNPKASVYYCNQRKYQGLLFKGAMEVMTDRIHREMLWTKKSWQYYPKGIDDEDYCVLKFTAKTMNFYYGLANTDFEINEDFLVE